MIKVFLLRSPEVEPDFMEEVLVILENSKGNDLQFEKLPIEWDHQDLYRISEYTMKPYKTWFRFRIDSKIKKQRYDPSLGEPLSWREFFSLCKYARKKFDIEDENFVILITKRRNAMNYFSMFETDGSRNIFIQSSDWEYIMETPAVLSVAYEVIANVLMVLGDYDLSNGVEEAFHKKSIGCVSDFCSHKKDILLKLRTADICPKCLKRLTDNGVERGIIFQSLEIFEHIRIKLKFSQGFMGTAQPQKVEIDKEGEVFIGGRKMNIKPLGRAIFILFLHHLDGIYMKELHKYEEELLHIYSQLKSNPNPESIANLVSPIDSNFTYNKSRLLKSLDEQLGTTQAQFYSISGVSKEKFKIPIPKDLVSIHERFSFNKS